MYPNYKSKMKNKLLILSLVLSFCPLSAYSTVQYMDTYNKDKAAKSSMKNKCTVCHTSSAGGGARNDFGKAFEQAGKKITDNLRQQFPQLFDMLQATTPRIKRVKPSKVALGQETIIMIMGANFAEDSIVRIDGTDTTGQTFVSPSRIDLSITFDTSGKHTIQIVSASGQVSNVFKIKVKG